MTASRVFLGVLLMTGAIAVACGGESDPSDGDDNEGGEGGERSSSTDPGTGGDDSENLGGASAVGDSCSQASDCDLDDAAHCTVSCMGLSGERRCVTTALDVDDDGDGSDQCAIAAGNDCNDNDDRDGPSSAYLWAQGTERCANSPCDARQSVAWAADGTPILVWGDTSAGTDGAIKASAIDENGLPTGDTTSWSLSGYPKVGSWLRAARKDSSDAFGVVFSGVTNYTAATGVSFLEGTLGVNSTAAATEIHAGSNVGGHSYQIDRVGAAWSLYGSGGYLCQYGYVSTGTDASSISDAGSAQNDSAVSGTTRAVLALDECGYMNDTYDPNLMLYRVAATSSTAANLSPVITLIDRDDSDADISPKAAVGTVGDDFAAFFYDSNTDVPLTSVRITTGGERVGDDKSYTSDIIPVAAEGLGDGGVLVGYIENGEDDYTVVVQRYNADLELIGDVIDIDDVATPPTFAEVTTPGDDDESGDFAIVYDAGDDHGYQLFHSNTCR